MTELIDYRSAKFKRERQALEDYLSEIRGIRKMIARDMECMNRKGKVIPWRGSEIKSK